MPTVYKPMSSYHDTDSSNDSFESDSSYHVNVSNTLGMVDNHEKWINQLTTNINSWKGKEDKALWSENHIKHWKNLTSLEERSINNWPESGSESFLKSLIRTPIMQRDFLGPPPKPDSPPEVFS